MKRDSEAVPFGPADILLPKEVTPGWPVVACDQFTSQPAYWQEVGRLVGDAPSTLRLILPEVFLGGPDEAERAAAVSRSMTDYLEADLFRTCRDAVILTERRLRDGRIRRGLVGAVDLDAYDYRSGSRSPIRATEGTVISRIPPRVAIRRQAALELPHVMILIDDPDNTVIPAAPTGEILYDTDLMMEGGHIRGSLLSGEAVRNALGALAALSEGRELLFAVGDGNHSLATAKACVDPAVPLSRYALAEIVNLRDPALDFEPIYRVVFGVDPAELVAEAKAAFRGASEHEVTVLSAGLTDRFRVNGLTVEALQRFLDDYLARRPGATVDYIHGSDTVRALSARPDAVGFLFDGIRKEDLFPYVEANGPLPRKTFSMGEAVDKRYYMEARRIR